MMNMKKVLTAGAMILALNATAITSFAAAKYQTPAEVAAGVTGQTVESVTAQRQSSGKTYGSIAAEAGKLDEFKAANIDVKKDRLSALVESGRLTQEEADSILKDMEENSAYCTGAGNGQGNRGLGFGCGNGGAGCGVGLGRNRA